LRFLLLHAGVDPAAGEIWIGLVGLPGGVLLMALLLRPRAADGPGLLSCAVVLTSTVALFVVWSVSSSVSYDGRHLASASIASMPLALKRACSLWRRRRPVVRPLLVGAGVVYIGLPFSIAGLLVAGATVQAPTGYVAGPSGIYNPLLATADLAAARAALLQDYNPATDVWYLPDPVTALDLPGRAIVDDVALTRVPVLSSFQSSAPVRVRALLPPEFEQNGLGEVVRAAFAGTAAWTESPRNGSRYVIWTTVVVPIGAEGAEAQPVAASAP
jgi:hypothetical protein